jgi:phosphoribosyl-ATP pyrophosphohydrolase/phosphoribosyl-AMP cyclohydrolase
MVEMTIAPQGGGGMSLLYFNQFMLYSKLMKLDFEKMGGLLPAIVQDINTREVLMLGFMNAEAWEKTLETGKVTFFSRTRNKLWTKGESSKNFLLLKKAFIDCDNDTVLIEAEPQGPTCHTGNVSCFFNKVKINK